MVFKEFSLVAALFPPTIIPWAKSVDMMSGADNIAYRDGITRSHFKVGGIDQIIIVFQVSSSIAAVFKSLMVTFQMWSNFMRSWISVPSEYVVWLSASWAWDQHMWVLHPHSIWIDSKASLAVPVVYAQSCNICTVERYMTSHQLY